MNQYRFTAAAVELDITPPPGYKLDGYASRTEISPGMHDPLMGQILLLKSEEKQIMLML